MSFEYDFPSLKPFLLSLEYTKDFRGNESWNSEDHASWYFFFKPIQNHCLDKARVKEAIMKFCMNDCVCGELDCLQCHAGKIGAKILKELGL